MAEPRKKPKSSRKKSKEIAVKLHKGLPVVELSGKDKIAVRIELGKEVSEKIAKEVGEEPISISLQSLDVDLHNQSYGMVAASTGCISNPGGPGC